MGKKSKTQTPEPMDTTAIGNQQATQNKDVWNQNLQASRPNQSNAFGNLTWEQDPTTGQWTQNVALNDTQQGLMGGLSGLAQGALGFSLGGHLARQAVHGRVTGHVRGEQASGLNNFGHRVAVRNTRLATHDGLLQWEGATPSRRCLALSKTGLQKPRHQRFDLLGGFAFQLPHQVCR